MKAFAGLSPIPSPVIGKLKHFKSQTDINAKTPTNPPQNPHYVDLHMHSAVISGNIGMIRFALDNGQSIHSSVNGLQAIHVASGFGQLAILKYLISRGANVNCRRGSTMPDGTEINNEKIKGPTPLHFAASNGHTQIVEYLLERGADPDIEDQYGCTPIDIASAQGYTDIYKLLVENSTIQNEPTSFPQASSSVSSANYKPSPMMLPGSPSSQSVTTPKLQYQNKIGTPNLQYQRKTSTPTIIYQNKPAVITVNRNPMNTSPPDHSPNFSKSPKIHNIKNGARSPILSSSQPKSPLLASRFNVIYNSQDYVQPRIRRGVSEKNIKQIGNDDLIYDTQKATKNHIANNNPLFIKDGNVISSSSYQVSSGYFDDDVDPVRSDSIKNSLDTKNKNSYGKSYDNSNYYNDNDINYGISDSDDEYIRGELNDSMLDKYTDSYSDSEILSPSNVLFNPSPPKSMTQLYHKNSNLFKGKSKQLERSNSSSSNRRKYSNGSIKNNYESDRESIKKVTRTRSTSRSESTNVPSYVRSRSRSNSRPDSAARSDINEAAGSYRPRSNSKPEIAYSVEGRRSRSNSNSKLDKVDSSVKNMPSNYYVKSGTKEKTTYTSSQPHSRSRSRSKSRSEHRTKSSSRSKSRSRSRSNSQSIANNKINNSKLSSSNVNTINTLFTFTNMKNNLNSPQSEISPNIQPSSYSSEFSVGSISDKDLVSSPSPGIHYSNSVSSTSYTPSLASYTPSLASYTPSLKSSIPERDSQSYTSSYLKGKSKYAYPNINSYSSHLYSSSTQSYNLPPSKIPLSAKASKSSIDPSQQSYSSLKGVNPCFPEGSLRSRSHSSSNPPVPGYPAMVNRNRSYSNASKSPSPFSKPAQTVVSSNVNPPDSNVKSKLNDAADYSIPRSSSS